MTKTSELETTKQQQVELRRLMELPWNYTTANELLLFPVVTFKH